MFFFCCGQETNLNVPQRAQYSGVHPRPAGGAHALGGRICSLNADMMRLRGRCLRRLSQSCSIPTPLRFRHSWMHWDSPAC